MEENQTCLLSQEFDIKPEEERSSFLLYQKRYIYKKNLIKTIIFCLLAIVFLIQVIKNPSYTLGIGLIGVCVAMIVAIWVNTKNVRDKLISALSEISDDKYLFELYEDKMTIRTVKFTEQNEIDDDYNTECIENTQDNQEEIKPEDIEASVIDFKTSNVEICNTDDLFAVFVKDVTLYTLPKRCFSEDQINLLEKVFNEALGTKYFSKLKA